MSANPDHMEGSDLRSAEEQEAFQAACEELAAIVFEAWIREEQKRSRKASNTDDRDPSAD